MKIIQQIFFFLAVFTFATHAQAQGPGPHGGRFQLNMEATIAELGVENAVLKKMRRQYSVEEFREKVDLIKSRLDRPAITTDVIVGYPGETDADFEATVELAKEAGFAKMHIFSFSPRVGTAAAAMQGAVNNKVIKSRSQILRDLEAELGCRFRQQFVGERDTVLLENSDGRPCGRSERYFMVYLEKTGGNLQKGELVKVRLVENSENGAIGQVNL